MTTKKQLKAKLERLEGHLTAQVDALHRSIIKCERVEHDLADADKTIDFQRAASRSLNTRLDEVEDSLRKREEFIVEIEDSLSCARCTNIDENGKKLHPQKCATCRRGAKDNYTPDKPDAEANVISDDFLKSTEVPE